MSLPSTSVAAVFRSAEAPFELQEVNIPALPSGSVLVEVLLCTICGSDLHTYHGRRSVPTPSVLGHEVVGRLVWPECVVDGAGKMVHAGDRLIWSLASSCGHCTFCESGLPQKCEQLVKYGHHAMSATWSLSGGLAKHCVIVPGTFYLAIPDDLPDTLAAPATCATATVSAAFSRAGDVTGKTVLVMGAGMLGSTACAMFDAAGAKSVIVADANAERAQSAKAFGAQVVIDASLPVEEFVKAIQDVNDGYGADIVLELAGANAAVERAISSTGVGGTCILVGSVYPQPPLPVVIEHVVRRMLNIRGVYNYAPKDLIHAVEFLRTTGAKYPFETLVEGNYSLSEVQEAFEMAGSQAAPYRVAVRPNHSGEAP